MGMKRHLEAIETRCIAGARMLKRKVAQAEVARSACSATFCFRTGKLSARTFAVSRLRVLPIPILLPGTCRSR